LPKQEVYPNFFLVVVRVDVFAFKEKKMKTKILVGQELTRRLDRVADLLRSAEDCLMQEDFTQCLVRLELISDQGKFDQVFKDICEAETESDTEK